MRTASKSVGLVVSLTAGLLVASGLLAQSENPPKEKNTPPVSDKAAAKKSQEDSVEFAQAAALLDAFSSAQQDFRKEPIEKNGEALDRCFAALAKARVHTPAGKRALEAAYETLAAPSGGSKPSWEYTFGQLAAWRKVRPDSAPASIATGKAYLNFAWEARGSGFAAQVGEENFMLFHARVDQAREFLIAAQVKTGVDAELYRLLIAVSKADGAPPEEAADWLRKAQKLDSHYVAAFTAAAENLMPRWGGEEGDLEKFSREVLSKLDGDEGKMIHTRVAVTLSMYGHHEVVKSKDSWERTHAGAILLAKKYPESIWCQNAAAFVGLRRNDRELCVQTLPVVEKNQVKALWTPRNFEMYVSFARPKIPPPPPVFIRAGETKSLAFLSKTGQLAAVGDRGLKTVSIWDADAKEPAATHPLKTLNVFAFDPTDEGGSIFLAYSLLDQPRNVAAVMNATTGEVQVISDDETKHIRTGDVSPDGKLAATIDGMLGENVTVWDVPGRKALQRLPHKGSQDRVEFSPDGQHLAVVARESTRIWNWKQKKEVLTVLAGQDPVKLGDYDEARFVDFRGEQAIFHAYSFARAEEYSFVACDLDDHMLHVLVRTGKFRTESCRLSPNKQLVAAIYSPENFQPPMQGVQVWDLEHGKLLGEIPPMHLEGRQQVAFSPDSSKLALCSPSPRGFEVFEISKLTSK